MASIGGVSGSNMTSSLYNSANVISGLASGLDTEGMIEGLVKSYQTKIQNLSNKATKLEWKQEAYRSIISKMYSFGSKYTSYSSGTNLMSASFFNSAVKIATMGANKDKVSATGRTESDIRLTSVKQLATSARYSTASNLKGISDDFSFMAEEPVKFDDTFDTGTLSGSLTLNYGGKTVSVVFDPSKDMIDNNLSASEKAAKLGEMIEKKLDDAKVTLSSGETKAASELIGVEVKGGQISFKDKTTGGNNVYMSGASDSVKSTLGLDLDEADEKKPATISVTSGTKLTKTEEIGKYISGATMNVSLDGKSKSIKLPTITKNADGEYQIVGSDGKKEALTGDSYAAAVQAALDKEFGAGKIKVTNESTATDYDGSKLANSMQLKFQSQANSDLVVNTDVGKAMGIGNIATNYLSTSKTLGELMEEGAWDGLTPAKGVGGPIEKNGKLVDLKGNLVNKDGNLVDKDGNELYAFKINGATIGNYGKGTTLSTIISDINSNSEAGVKVSYSQTTRKFTFTSKDTGSENDIKIGEGLAETIFGSTELSDTSPADKTFGDIYGASWLDGQKVKFQFDGFELEVTVGKDDRIEDVARKLNETIEDNGYDYTAAYNKYTGQLEVTDKDGQNVRFEMSTKDNLGEEEDLKLSFNQDYAPKISYTRGQDAKFSVEINGEAMEMTRGSNTFSLDGLNVTLKDTFNTAEDIAANNGQMTEAVTFQRSTDSDKIVEAVKSMIADYNEMMAEIRGQYATLPYQSNGSFKDYEPLTDEEKASMSESAIQKYEEKAKQGLLFNDSNLSALYNRMLNVFSPGGEDEALLRQMGISVSFSSTDNSSSITLDESKLRSMLDSDPDAVADLFTRSASAGNASSDGLMQSMKTQLDRYAGTTGAVKGILVQQAGTPLSSLTLMNNTWQNQIDSIYTDIEKWQDKLTAQVDKYTSMFSKLETLIYQMNSQSSTLAGMMGMGG